MSEFFSVGGNLILDPVRGLKELEQDQQLSTDKRVGHADMKSFLSRHKDDFNQSQLEALHKVADMNQKDLLLIQGPVSSFAFLLTVSD